MALFSVIVPVYQAETYIGECLDSLVGQTYSDFEAVCVSDGTTDDSVEIIKGYARRDERFRLVCQDNGGPSSARNRGMREANGDYIVFLDADDKLADNALASIREQIEREHADVVVFGWSCFPGDGDRWMKEHSRVRDVYYPHFEPAVLFSEMTQPYLRVAVRRTLLEEHEIRFDEGLYLGEDAQFLFQLYPQARGIQLVSDELYFYRLAHEGSIMERVSRDVTEECFQHLNTAISIFADWKRRGLLAEYGADLLNWSVGYTVYSSLRQPERVRGPLVKLTRELWTSCWSEPEIANLAIPAHARLLVHHIVDGPRGNLTRDLLAYRIAEYGLGDLIFTLRDRIVP